MIFQDISGFTKEELRRNTGRIFQDISGYFRILQETSGYFRILRDTSGYFRICEREEQRRMEGLYFRIFSSIFE